MMSGKGDELRARVRKLGPKRVASASGLPFQTLSSWLNAPDAEMRSGNMERLLDGVRALELPEPDFVSLLGADYLPVPIYSVRASAGAGAFVEDGEPSGHELHAVSWLRSVASGPLNMLSVIEVDGDSMEDTLRPGDHILVDRSVNGIVKDGIYVLLYEGNLLVKRCQRDLSDGSVIIRSDNPRYEPFRITKQDGLTVVGKVVWHARIIG